MSRSPEVTRELHEWQAPEFIKGVSLTDADQDLRERLEKGDDGARLGVDELRDGLRVRATSWVGVVRFEHVELRIVPKLVGGNLGVLRMVNYASGLGSLKQLPRDFSLSLGEPNLLDLVCRLLANEAKRLVVAGLLRGYIEREEAVPVLRGRFLPIVQARRHSMMLDQLECRFEEFEADVLENRLVAAGLSAARRLCRDEVIARDVRLMHSIFTEACDPTLLDYEAASLLDYDRRNSYYKSAHVWARLLLRGMGLRDLFEAGEGRAFAFLLDMNDLFEAFVTRLVADAFKNDEYVMVEPQARNSIIQIQRDTGTFDPYSSVIPDLLVTIPDQGGQRRVPLDAKYKLYDKKKLQAADVYQAFVYSYAFGRKDTTPVALLLYPSASGSSKTVLRVLAQADLRASRIIALGLDVPRLLEMLVSDEPRLAPTAIRTQLIDAWRSGDVLPAQIPIPPALGALSL